MIRCPRCESDQIEFFAGDFPTGVVAPDGVKETRWETGVECQKCGLRFDPEDGEEEPHQISCSLCGRPTTIDPIYGDLCYRCCRAENE